MQPQSDRWEAEDDEYDRRPQRRRYEEPLHLKLRKQLLSVAESVCWHPQMVLGGFQPNATAATQENG